MVLTSCGTTQPVGVWRDANYEPTPVHRIFVVENTSDTGDPVTLENAVALEIAIARALRSRGLEVTTSTAVFPLGPVDDEKVGAFVKDNRVDLVLALRGHVDDPLDPALLTYFTGDIKVYTAQRYPRVPIWIGAVRTFTAYADTYGPGSEARVPRPESVLQRIAAPMAASVVRSLVKDQILVL